MNFDIIWLNGTSSSGKTTLSKELQSVLNEHFMHVCFDTFYQMLPARFKPSTEPDSKWLETVHLGFEYSIPALARAGNRLIVDCPFYCSHSLLRCLELVWEYSVLYVGVFCPVDILGVTPPFVKNCTLGLESTRGTGAISGSTRLTLDESSI
jgi:chloramphenicol 3-O phosphotransferase